MFRVSFTLTIVQSIKKLPHAVFQSPVLPTIQKNRTEFISINLYKVHRLKYKIYMHNITRDSRKKEDRFFRKGGYTHYKHVKKERKNREILKYVEKHIYIQR